MFIKDKIPDYERFITGNYTIRSDLIYDNFLLLNVYMEKPAYTTIKTTEQYTVTSLFGALGGVLNLWIGITFLSLVEICDLVYQLIKARYTRNSNQITQCQKNENQ